MLDFLATIGTGHSSDYDQGVVHEAQIQLWLSNENISKSKNQRERRIDHSTCINDQRNGKYPKEHLQSKRTSTTYSDRSIHTKPGKDKSKIQERSLENVSNTKGEASIESSPNLRRCKSLALTKEDIFNSFETSFDGRQNRRAQLIPRVKLSNKTTGEQRYRSQRASNEELHLRPHRRKTDAKFEQSSGRLSRQKTGPIIPPRTAEEKEFDDRLDCHPRSYRFTEVPADLKLPNFYPDSRYDSDVTDNTSTLDNIFADKKKYLSCDNLFTQNFPEEPESIPYDENIVLSKNRSFHSSLQDTIFKKPKTIRRPSTLNSEEYFSVTCCRNDKIDGKSTSTNEHEPQNDSINNVLLAMKDVLTKNGEKDDEINSSNVYAAVEINPVYEKNYYEPTKNEQFSEICELSTHQKRHSTKLEIYDVNHNSKNTETVVCVDTVSTLNSTNYEAKETEQKHSHKYLREFLESQKGSKKPLQNFLTNKILNLSRRNSKDKETNSVDNLFSPLPDIAACNNLKKCDKIDRRLRKCDKISKSGESDNRFIVNIGKHFDVTNNNIPVDFELKLAKVPKRNKIYRDTSQAIIQAIQDLKTTLGENKGQIDSKPEVIAVQKKTFVDLESNEKGKMIKNEAAVEYLDKLENMSNTWKKHIGYRDDNRQNSECEASKAKTKIEVLKSESIESPEITEQMNMVRKTKEIFEKKIEQKLNEHSTPFKSSKGIFQNPIFEKEHTFESLNSNNVEVDESKNAKQNNRQNNQITKSLSISYPEFDHVRYRVVKSNLFQKKFFANYEKESQFEGLMQYLQDYSFQELLMDNNIVIIEPIRTTLIRESQNKNQNPSKNIPPLSTTKIESKNDKQTLRKRFFFHPIRVNKEVNDDELPNPDTVKQVRQIFEKNQKNIIDPIKKGTEIRSSYIDIPEKDNFPVNTFSSKKSELFSEKNWDAYDDEACCEQQYITEDMMEKIRKYGTTVTYYGGRIVRKQSSHESLTNVILEEIRNNVKNDHHTKCDTPEENKMHQKLRFKLVKSNSCSSRMELVGTKNLALSKQNYLNNREKSKQLRENTEDKITIHNNNGRETSNENEINKQENEHNIQSCQQNARNKIYTKWGDSNQEQTIYGIQISDRALDTPVIYNYHTNLEKNKKKMIEDMDFEPFEIA